MKLGPSKRQTGAGLIEVLIAVLVLAVGLLGFAGLQTQALRMNYDALQRSRASMMAEDLFDRMRANRQGALTGSGYEFTNMTADDVLPAVLPDCNVSDCNPDQMAAWDVNDWLTRLTDASPGAEASMTEDGGRYVITIRLVEQVEGVLAGQQSDAGEDIDLDTNQTLDYQFETQFGVN